VTDPWARPANQARPVPPPPQFPHGPPQGQPAPPPHGPPQGQPAPPPHGAQGGPHGAQGGPQNKDSSLLVKIKKLFRDPLSIVLVVVIVIADGEILRPFKRGHPRTVSTRVYA